MIKICLTFIFVAACVSECSVINVGPKDDFGFPDTQFLRSTDEITSNLAPHIIDFLMLIDGEKMTMTALQYMSDPEVIMFMNFVLSPQFKILIWDFESMEEFKEAYAFLASKGYDTESMINFVNTALNLPPFEKHNELLRSGKGISGFLEAMVGTLPIKDMKKLFESKLQSSPEVADLFETINSQEFMDIMRRMRDNPKFTDIKITFESYGFDFKYICKGIKDILGDYYQGIFCE